MEKLKNVGIKKGKLEERAIGQIAKKPSLSVDYEAYAHLLDASEMNEEKKREFIQALWSVIYGFASLGFEVHPVQQSKKQPCGQVQNRPRKFSSEQKSRLEFNASSKQGRSTKRITAEQSGAESAIQ